jgi:hypothetical protein
MELARMNIFTLEKVGGASLILGSLLLAAYSALFPVLLPIGNGTYDFVAVVLNPNWVRLAVMAFAGVILMQIGFYAVYSRIRSSSGMVGAIGFLFMEAAYLLQACKVTWELFLYPIIATYPMSTFLLRDVIIRHDPAVGVFRIMAAISILLGTILFCYSLFRSSEYPKSAAVLIFSGAVVYALGPMISIFVSVAGIFVFAAGCLLIGVRLFQVNKV